MSNSNGSKKYRGPILVCSLLAYKPFSSQQCAFYKSPTISHLSKQTMPKIEEEAYNLFSDRPLHGPDINPKKSQRQKRRQERFKTIRAANWKFLSGHNDETLEWKWSDWPLPVVGPSITHATANAAAAEHMLRKRKRLEPFRYTPTSDISEPSSHVDSASV